MTGSSRQCFSNLCDCRTLSPYSSLWYCRSGEHALGNTLAWGGGLLVWLLGLPTCGQGF